jgi:uncharacterized protein
MNSKVKTGLLVICSTLAGASLMFASLRLLPSDSAWPTPFVDVVKPAKPLEKYSIPNLAHYSFQASTIQVEKELQKNDSFTSYLFTYQTLGKKMSGQLNIPHQLQPNGTPAIVMIRGYVPPEIYQTGVGTKNAAAVLAKAGFITVAPDFFSFGESDPEPEDTWQGRFEKPVAVIELIKTLQNSPLTLEPTPELPAPTVITIPRIGLWGHSNGGQIALTTLEILGQPIPTTLWAPVTAPFPYSVLFFSDENADEGKATRKWISEFEKTYDVFDFSLTQHLDRLTGPIQLHHGGADEAALQVWSDEFEQKVKTENELREKTELYLSTASATTSELPTQPLPPIELLYFRYPGADHNLQPSWQTVVDRDLEFFKKHLTL